MGKPEGTGAGKNDVVFKRRDKRSYSQLARDFVYPKGGFRRATWYLIHRMRRLPDQPHRIARGVAAGTFVNFPPLFGFQMLSAAGLAWLVRGNILAALLATFLSNPLTTPFIIMGSLKLGHWMLGIERALTFGEVLVAFTDAGKQVWDNILAIFGPELTHWDKLNDFFWYLYFPFFVGSIIPGLIFSVMLYYLTLPLVNAYQSLRASKFREKAELRRAAKAARVAAQAEAQAAGARGAGALAAKPGSDRGDVPPGKP